MIVLLLWTDIQDVQRFITKSEIWNLGQEESELLTVLMEEEMRLKEAGRRRRRRRRKRKRRENIERLEKTISWVVALLTLS